jgi:hypothetical protein
VALVLILGLLWALLGAPYDRGAWQHWIDADGDCENTRTEILIRDSLVRPILTDGCVVLTGLWVDPYSLQVFRVARDLDVDHVIPLAWAHAHGAEDWDAGKRRLFANDPTNLVAVGARWNRQKGAQGPSGWVPPDPAGWCAYGVRFMAVATAYGLQIPDADLAALAMLQRACGR